MSNRTRAAFEPTHKIVEDVMLATLLVAALAFLVSLVGAVAVAHPPHERDSRPGPLDADR